LNLILRRLRDENDYWRIRDFVRQVFLLNGRRQTSWHIARLDYWWARRHEFLPDTPIEQVVFIWETQEGQIAAVLHPEHKGIVFQQVHPELRTPDLEEEMLSVAEEHLAVTKAEGKRRLLVVADQHDRLRQDILLRRGYNRFDHPQAREHQRRRSLDEPLPQIPLVPGYSVRSLKDDEIPARGLAAWKTTRSDEPYDDFVGWKWLLNVYQAPLYRRDLDIVVVAPNGEIASFCTLWFDDVTRSGYFEPVGTAQDYQRRGLARAVMEEALRRLKQMGATMAFVSSYTPPAHKLYASLGFSDYDLCEPWEKAL
jgi:mycothiol synthase